MAKLPAGTKGWIVKLYKAGGDINEIQQKVKKNFSKITKTQIRSVARKHLIDLADDLWSVAIKVKFGWKCAVSNKAENLQSHHLIRRGNWTHRWTIMNGICLNGYFHDLGDDIAAHGATDVTERFRDWMIKYHPEQWAWFEKHRNDPSEKPDIDELLKIIDKLKKEVQNACQLNTKGLGERGPAQEQEGSNND